MLERRLPSCRDLGRLVRKLSLSRGKLTALRTLHNFSTRHTPGVLGVVSVQNTRKPCGVAMTRG